LFASRKIVLVETRENSVRCPDESKGGEQLMDRLGKREREQKRVVRLVRYEVQGVWELFRATGMLPPEQWEGLNEGSMRVREGMRSKELECGYCGALREYRNGSYMLPSLLVEGVHMIELEYVLRQYMNASL